MLPADSVGIASILVREQALRELSKKRLYAALGHASFGELLDARKVMSRSQAAKLVQIVSALPRHEALAIGEEKAYALVRLAASTSDVDSAASIVEKGAVAIAGKKIAIDRASVRQLSDAARDARQTAAKARPATPAEAERATAEKTARAAQARLRREGMRGATVEAKKIAGAWWARVSVRMSEVRSLRAAAKSGPEQKE